MKLDKKTLKELALKYHSQPQPGKISVTPSKSCESQDDLALAYTPGVAAPVREIAEDKSLAYQYTSKGNLVAVISNGTAVLGLGNVGPIAGKPVMEGKGILFKKFANIDVFDIELNSTNVDDVVRTVVDIAPTFGGINLEDIAAPACFEIEQQLKEKLDIPVFHDDQHGTAIIISAAIINALTIQNKQLDEIKIVCIGAGSAGIASMNLLLELGVRKEQINMVDRQGVVQDKRDDLNKYKQAYATKTNDRTLADAMKAADVVIGVSGPNIISAEMIQSMAAKPIIFALSNPDPEITPELIHATRDDAIVATGRSDYPNQVNNVLGFPYIFRGALDAKATAINKPMFIAAAKALAKLAQEPVPQEVLDKYQLDDLSFGPNYIIPTPFDPRLNEYVSTAVAEAAKESGAIRKN
ncbi:MAG: malate dehydrogenase [Gammaproteobacteria bacterium]|nr:malate dehydrogenase [Gammaproteobacteria bacterium]